MCELAPFKRVNPSGTQMGTRECMQSRSSDALFATEKATPE